MTEKNVRIYQDPHEVAVYSFGLALGDVIKRFIPIKKEPKEIFPQKDKEDVSLQDNRETIVENAKEFVNILDLSTYDMNLLAIAALFDYIYKSNNKVNQKNITEFIKHVKNTADPIDIIRYIRIYQLLKTSIKK